MSESQGAALILRWQGGPSKGGLSGQGAECSPTWLELEMMMMLVEVVMKINEAEVAGESNIFPQRGSAGRASRRGEGDAKLEDNVG